MGYQWLSSCICMHVPNRTTHISPEPRPMDANKRPSRSSSWPREPVETHSFVISYTPRQSRRLTRQLILPRQPPRMSIHLLDHIRNRHLSSIELDFLSVLCVPSLASLPPSLPPSPTSLLRTKNDLDLPCGRLCFPWQHCGDDLHAALACIRR
jgi:hypothetical protein